MRKTLTALALAAAILGISGCSRILEGEHTYSKAHTVVSTESREDAEMVLEAEDYDELCAALDTFIENGVERGAVRFSGYSGDVEGDLAQAVLTVYNDTPEGAYCVYYINYSISRIVTVYEASVSIIYRHTPGELSLIKDCQTPEELEAVMLDALKLRADKVTVRVPEGLSNEAAVNDAAERAYYGAPESILYFPAFQIGVYPESGQERIVEITLSYPYATSTVESRARNLSSKADRVAGGISGETVEEKLLGVADYFAENTVYNETVNSSDILSRRYSAMTAYGALVQGSAVGEGYAMATKVLCDRMGIDCTVIRGRFNNIDHAWNLVRLDNGALYHLDCSNYDPEGAVLKNDSQQLYANYWWDREAYDACDGPSLYGEEFDPPEPGEADAPAAPDEPDTPSVPVTPNEPDTPEAPGQRPGVPGEPVTPDVPVTPPDEPTTPPDEQDKPGDPDDPEDPGENEGPGGPGGTDEPVDPNDPGDPEDPGVPEDPDNPEDPEDPAVPEDPDEPVEPEPEEPVEGGAPGEEPQEPSDPGAEDGRRYPIDAVFG